jgi:23S rRNA (adenine2503-C2)-methyltransferase
MSKENLFGLSADEILHLIEPFGYTIANAISITNSIYKKSTDDISKIAGIPKRLQEKLAPGHYIGSLEILDHQVSADKSVKYLFRSEAGKKFETVYIPEKNRHTVCVSTQSGCRMGCSFCATGIYGFHGNLSAGDIVNQILNIPQSKYITHVVFMGMGEPMDNLRNVLKACDIITAEWGIAISPRNVTVSTIGITPSVEKFLMSTECNLTVSLHSPFPDERTHIVPVENRYPIHRIVEIMKNYPLKKKRRLSVAYIMIKGMNDTDSHLKAIITLLKGSKIRVNLIPYHQVNSGADASSTGERMQYFKHQLVTSGISASIRKSRGIDISAACGLLASGLK